MHELRYLDYGEKATKENIIKHCSRIADEEGDYKGQITRDGIRFNNHVCDSYDAAYNWINNHDNGWYDNIAVRYKENDSIRWLVKIEYHC